MSSEQGDNNVDNTVKKPEGGKAGKAAKNTAKKAIENRKKIKDILLKLFTTPIGHVILWALLFILFVIILIGFVGFLLTMPGMVLEKFFEAINNMWGNIWGFFTGETIEAHIDDAQIVDLANYIEDLGYDIDLYGFGQKILVDNQADDEEDVIAQIKPYTDMGVQKNYLKKYILSNEATYTKTEPTLGSLIFNDPVNSSQGMITFVHNDWEMEIMRPQKLLRVSSNWLWGGDQYTFVMDGWTGRYGKPLELMLAIHLSTMMPDLAYEVATAPPFDTKLLLDTQAVNKTITNFRYVPNGSDDTLYLDDIDALYEQLSNLATMDETEFQKLKEIISAYKDLLEQIPAEAIIASEKLAYQFRLSNEINNVQSINYEAYEIYENSRYKELIDDYINNSSEENIMNRLKTDLDNFRDSTAKVLSGESDYDSKTDREKAEIQENLRISGTEGFERVKLHDGTYIYDTEIAAGLHQSYEIYYKYIWEEGNIYSNFFSEYVNSDTNRNSPEFLSKVEEVKNEISTFLDTLVRDIDKIGAANAKLIEQNQEASDLLEEYGLTFEQLEELYRLGHEMERDDGETIQTYQPRIVLVARSWYYDTIKFYYQAEGSGTGSNTRPFDRSQEVVGYEHLGELDGEIFYDESTQAEDGGLMVQTGEPDIEGPNDCIKAVFKKDTRTQYTQYYDALIYNDYNPLTNPSTFLAHFALRAGLSLVEGENIEVMEVDGKYLAVIEDALPYKAPTGYYRYDGTETKAKAISEARKIDSYLKNHNVTEEEAIQALHDGYTSNASENGYEWKGQYLQVESRKVNKEEVKFDDKQNALQALSILEGMHTLDSDYIYRDLKDLLIELDYFKEEDFQKPFTQVLDWIIPSYSPEIWPGKEVNEFGVTLKHNNDTGEEEQYELGFMEDEEVITPGAGKITKLDINNKVIEITFRELDDEYLDEFIKDSYGRVNKAIDREKTKNIVKDLVMRIEGVQLDETLTEGQDIDRETVIGTTSTNDIKLMLFDQKHSIMENIEDYIGPDEGTSGSGTSIEFMYWMPYESGAMEGPGRGPAAVGCIRDGIEYGAGICQWTTISGGINNIASLCAKLAQLEPDLCSRLSRYGTMDTSQIIANIDNIRTDFAYIDTRDHDRFLEAQIGVCKEQFFISQIAPGADNVPWLENRRPVVQGTYLSLNVWGPNLPWESVISENQSDLEVVKNLLKKATTYESTVGSLNARWTSQYAFARDIINGVLSAEEIETMIKTGNLGQYSNGLNMHSLD